MNYQPESSDYIARLNSVTQLYGETAALENISIDIPSACKVGIIGPDGAGKSTVLGLISGVRKVQSGTVEVLSGNIAKSSHRDNICHRIAYIPQGLGKNLYSSISVYENLNFFAKLFNLPGTDRNKRISHLLQNTGLYEFKDRKVGQLSGGMKQKLGLCSALIHSPDLLILDEPTTGVDPLSRMQFWELIKQIIAGKKNVSVIGATAYMEEAEKFDWLVVMNRGRILATGKPADLKLRTNSKTIEEMFINLLTERIGQPYGKLEIPPGSFASGENSIEAIGLTKKFGDFVAVNDVSFQIKKGEIFGFVGSNGCGKTTTIKMLTGLLTPSGGSVRLFDEPLNVRNTETRKRFGYMSQSFSLYNELTVYQNLYIHARLFELKGSQIEHRISELVEQMGLEDVLHRRSSSLPLGIKQRLSLAVAVIHKPEVLILDEPTSGVDPLARDQFWELLIELSRSDGVTIFITTHFMNEAERCDRISLMHSGKVLVTDKPESIISSRNEKNLEHAFISYIKESIGEKPRSVNTEKLHQNIEDKWDYRGRIKKFSIGRLVAFAHRESIEVISDPVRLFFALIGPIILMVVLGYGISFDVEDLPYAVMDRDQSPESREYLDYFSGSRYFNQHQPITSYDDLENRLMNGNLMVAIEIPPGFGRDLRAGHQPEIAAWLDGGFPFRAETARGYLSGINETYIHNLISGNHSEVPVKTFDIQTRILYNQDMKSVFSMVPGIMAMLLAMVPSILTAVGVVREKELGSITNLYSTPATKPEFIIGKQIPYIMIGIVNFISLLCLAIFLFNVPVQGDLLALVSGALIFVVSTTGFGLLVSAFTRTQIAALFGAFLITMINSISFSGFFQPVSSLTGGGRILAWFFPTTYFMNISRGVFTKSLNFEQLYDNFIALGIFVLFFLILSISFLKKQEA